MVRLTARPQSGVPPSARDSPVRLAPSSRVTMAVTGGEAGTLGHCCNPLAQLGRQINGIHPSAFRDGNGDNGQFVAVPIGEARISRSKTKSRVVLQGRGPVRP